MNPYTGEIRIFAGNFAPNGWALCNGQLITIMSNPALFSLLGTSYGGNGTTNFALPNFQGMAPMHVGQGPGLSYRVLGETVGEPNVTLLQSEMPAHTHTPRACGSLGNQPSPAGNVWAGSTQKPYQAAAPNTQMNPAAISVQGGSQPHNNMQPYLTLSFIIALQGVYPPRG